MNFERDELTWAEAQRLGERLTPCLTVRQWLCGLAMGGLLNWRERQDTPEKIAVLACEHADRLLLEMARRGQQPHVSPMTEDAGEDLVDLNAPL